MKHESVANKLRTYLYIFSCIVPILGFIAARILHDTESRLAVLEERTQEGIKFRAENSEKISSFIGFIKETTEWKLRESVALENLSGYTRTLEKRVDILEKDCHRNRQ